MKKVTTLAIIGLSAIALTACSSGSDSKKDAKASEAKTEQKASSSSEENVSTEFKNARKKAESYEKLSIFRKKDLKTSSLVSISFQKMQLNTL